MRAGKRFSLLRVFLDQFKSLIIWILIIAGVISGVAGEAVDAIAILAIVVINAVINAEKSIDALNQMTAPLARVRGLPSISVDEWVLRVRVSICRAGIHVTSTVTARIR